MNTPRPRLLYLSPVVPAMTGNGLAMRAGMTVRLLASHYRVSLLVVRLYPPFQEPIPPAIADVCDEAVTSLADHGTSRPAPLSFDGLRRWVRHVTLGRSNESDDRTLSAARVFHGRHFDVIHVFRLAMLPYARPYVDRAGPSTGRHLDLDDVESVTRRRVAELYRANGYATLADSEEAAALRAETLECEVLRDFDRLYVCSQGDRARLERSGGARVCVLPNTLPLPAPLPPPLEAEPFTFLFIGTLGYYPNEDGIIQFCTNVLPLIRQRASRDVRVIVAGAGATRALQQLIGLPGVQLIGPVPDVATTYREAHAVVVPIRAGGGTRIKVLEAFSYRRPVVATSIGIEGIAAQPDRHFLRGDTPAELADQCVRLLLDSSLREQLADAAYELFRRAYTVEAAARSLIACDADTPRSPGE
ncbi:MAG TPA: glycosyltransferase [Chloroflexota bacterium]|nr:glycosyltransferase [Chloroflexota bacterium]